MRGCRHAYRHILLHLRLRRRIPASKYALGCTPTGSNGPASLKVEVSDSGVTEVTHYTGSYNCAGTPEMSWSSPCGGVCTLVTNAGGHLWDKSTRNSSELPCGYRLWSRCDLHGLAIAVQLADSIALLRGNASQGQGQFNPLHAKGHDMCSTSVGPEVPIYPRTPQRVSHDFVCRLKV